MPRYAELIYYGFWFAPRTRNAAATSTSRRNRRCTVRLKLYKGNVIVIGRPRIFALPRILVTFRGRPGAYDQKDAAGFIKLNALRLRTLALRKRKNGKKGRQGVI